MDFHRVPNQVLYQAEPLPDVLERCEQRETGERQNACPEQWLQYRPTNFLTSPARKNYSIHPRNAGFADSHTRNEPTQPSGTNTVFRDMPFDLMPDT